MSQITHFSVTKRRRNLDIPVNQVQVFRANGNYVDLLVQEDKYLYRTTMNALESMLSSSRFLRIHRSWIVNVDWIRNIQYLCNNEYRFTLMDGTEVVSGRSFKPQIADFLTELEKGHRHLRQWAFNRAVSAA